MANDIPVQEVIELRKQGADNEKIIDVLRSKNYSFQQIRDAIQQAEIKSSIDSPSNPTPETPKPESPMGVPPPTVKPQVQSQQPQQTTAPQPTTATMQPQTKRMAVDLDEIQRILEEIIEEKWKESEKTINSLIEWKIMADTKIKNMESQINELNSRIDSLNTVLGQKAEAFNETIENVDTEIKALEKALNRLVPALSDNISELKDIVSNMKKE